VGVRAGWREPPDSSGGFLTIALKPARPESGTIAHGPSCAGHPSPRLPAPTAARTSLRSTASFGDIGDDPGCARRACLTPGYHVAFSADPDGLEPGFEPELRARASQRGVGRGHVASGSFELPSAPGSGGLRSGSGGPQMRLGFVRIRSQPGSARLPARFGSLRQEASRDARRRRRPGSFGLAAPPRTCRHSSPGRLAGLEALGMHGAAVAQDGLVRARAGSSG
jgi:hypothetical protein